jgi:PAS domain S-box-containing protein
MRHNPLLISERAKKVLNRHMVLLCHGLISSAAILDFVAHRTTESSINLAIITTLAVVFTALGVMRYFNVLDINTKPGIYLTIYHVLFAIGFGLFAPAYSPFILVWLILFYVTKFYYDSPGFMVSSALYFVTLLWQAFRVLPADASILSFLQFILVQFVVVVTIGLFFLETESVSDKDRKLLITSIDKAQLERQRLIALINSMADGVISTDDQGIIKLYNAAALNILDTNQSLQDKDVRTVLNVIDQSAKTVDLVSEAAQKNINITSTDVLLVYPDGEKINLYLNISPIKLSFQQNIERGFIISFRDITREKSLEEERNEFISVVSHELRTPIAITEANISNAQFMADKGSNLDAIKSSLEAAHKQALFLANMINDLSTLSRAERGKLDMVTETVNPREIMSSLIDDYTKEAETKGLELSTEIADDTPQSITSNRLYVREILQNFLTNSIKYTKEGGVHISVRGEDKGIVFSVKDTGIGISKSDQKRVFDKFFRSEDFRTRESSGTGLGLYVTKKLMKLISAEIEVKSKLNEGSTFSVHIPNLSKDHKISS